ncbi:hypothetical protein HYG77_32320 (plasmid) [Rhodococcus sp. ZPP]|nr:hypothetical protein [Rhodococcus sp. ZPP]QTJ70253.1 hypothetical protein HYG77_32320 [Rhodococcus sp. ZPP]
MVSVRWWALIGGLGKVVGTHRRREIIRAGAKSRDHDGHDPAPPGVGDAGCCRDDAPHGPEDEIEVGVGGIFADAAVLFGSGQEFEQNPSILVPQTRGLSSFHMRDRHPRFDA